MKYSIQVKLRQDFVREEEGKIVVGLKSSPIHNKANKELIMKLAKFFKATKEQIKIIHGLHSKNKIIEVI